MKFSKIFFLSFLISVTFAQAETFFSFPHYGDGAGLSMSFTFENPTDMEATVHVSIYDSAGNLASLTFVGYGTYSNFNFDLEPQGSLTLKTTGTSNPLKVGDILVESDNDNITGVAIFQYASGGETSILPVEPKKRFVLPFEKNNNMDLGLAISRVWSVPVELELYNEDGDLVDYVYYNPPGYHSAAFSAEIFGTVPISKGSLLLKSTKPFAPMGLRFGNGVLASLPSDEAKEISQYWAEKMLETSTFWFFYYTIGSSTSTNTYNMVQVVDFEEENPEYKAFGDDEWGDPAIAAWFSSLGKLYMLDSSFIFDYAYTFNFTSDDEIEGCMYMRDKDTGDLGTCYPLTGERFIFSPSSAEQDLRIQDKSENRRDKEFEMYEKFVPVTSSGPVKEAFDNLAEQISPNVN